MKGRRKPEFYLAACLLLKKGNKVLLLRRFKTGWADGLYAFPGGHLERDETLLEGTRREAKEEVGVDVKKRDMKVVHAMLTNDEDREYLTFYITASRWKGKPKLMERNKADDVGWFTLSKLPPNTLPSVSTVIKKINAGELYSEVGF